jgi:predicted membrane protein
MAGVELDFTEAGLAGNQGAFEVTAILGVIDIRVPNDWEVVVDSSAFLGGVEDKHRPTPAADKKPTLFIKATAILGGIDIK